MSETATKHWAEGNRYAMKFIHSIFIINTTVLSVAIGIKGYSADINPAIIDNAPKFAIASLLSLLAFASAYFAQLNYGNRDDEKDPLIKHQKHLYALIFHNAAYCLVGVSLLFTICAYWNLLVALKK